MAGTNCRLQPRDRRLLRTLQLLRLVDREQAKLFAPFGSTARANARLLQLTTAGYLARRFVGTISGGRKAIYFLPGRAPHVRGFRGTESVEHDLAVNAVYHAFLSSGHAVEWRMVREPLPGGAGVIPDGLVLSGKAASFIEVDRGTETLRVVERKFRGYIALALSGEHARITGSTRFRVLFITTSERRAEHLRERAETLTDKLFWFTTLSALQERGPWSAIWLRPVGDEYLPLP